jgi:hypothetical protein
MAHHHPYLLLPSTFHQIRFFPATRMLNTKVTKLIAANLSLHPTCSRNLISRTISILLCQVNSRLCRTNFLPVRISNRRILPRLACTLLRTLHQLSHCTKVLQLQIAISLYPLDLLLLECLNPLLDRCKVCQNDNYRLVFELLRLDQTKVVVASSNP